MKVKDDKIQLKGRVIADFKGRNFRVRLVNGHEVMAYPCGKMRLNKILIDLGDLVLVELGAYDLNKARIIWRYKDS